MTKAYDPFDWGRDYSDVGEARSAYTAALDTLTRIQAKLVYHQQLVATKRDYLLQLNNDLARLSLAHDLLRAPDYLIAALEHIQFDLGSDKFGVDDEFEDGLVTGVELVADDSEVVTEHAVWSIMNRWGGWGHFAGAVTDLVANGEGTIMPGAREEAQQLHALLGDIAQLSADSSPAEFVQQIDAAQAERRSRRNDEGPPLRPQNTDSGAANGQVELRALDKLPPGASCSELVGQHAALERILKNATRTYTDVKPSDIAPTRPELRDDPLGAKGNTSLFPAAATPQPVDDPLAAGVQALAQLSSKESDS